MCILCLYGLIPVVYGVTFNPQGTFTFYAKQNSSCLFTILYLQRVSIDLEWNFFSQMGECTILDWAYVVVYELAVLEHGATN